MEKNKSKESLYQKNYYYSEKGQAKLERARVKNIREQIVVKLGGVCKKCGFDDIRALQVDHIAGGGKKHILSFKGNFRSYYRYVLSDNTKKFQLLCANCNWIKRYENKECSRDR